MSTWPLNPVAMREPSLPTLACVSVALHLAALASATLWLPGPESPSVQKASIRFALGSRGSAPGAAEQHETPEFPPPDPDPAPQPSPPQPKPQPKPVPEEPRERVQRPSAPPPPAVTAAPARVGQQGRSGRDTPTRLDTDGSTNEAGYQALLRNHDALVLGHLARFKAYPRRARVLGDEGDVGVEFRIGRDGALLDHRLVTSSGHRSLDRAALRQMRDAVPYPVAPDDAPWTTRTYRTEMRFSLR